MKGAPFPTVFEVLRVTLLLGLTTTETAQVLDEVRREWKEANR